MRVTADNPVSLGGTKFKLIKDHTCDNCIEKWAVLADGPTDQPLTITVRVGLPLWYSHHTDSSNVVSNVGWQNRSKLWNRVLLLYCDQA